MNNETKQLFEENENLKNENRELRERIDKDWYVTELKHDIDIFWHSNMRDGNETRHAVCAIHDRPPFKPVTHTEGAPMINCVYKSVVEFIKWHNSQQK